MQMEGESSAVVLAAAASASASVLFLAEKVGSEGCKEEIGCSSSCGQSEGGGICAICLEKIVLQETALVKGCEHAYCVNCILRWASYNKAPSCPQCKHPFDFLIIHRTLDDRIQDFMFEESVCLLLRASWFVPLTVDPQEPYEEQDFFLYDEYDADDDDIEEDYYITRSPTLHIGNRRWGDNGYIRSGRKEARPVNRQQPFGDSSGGSSSRKNKEAVKELTGRRAKRALKREAADKAAAAKHLQHLERLGRK